MRERRRKVIAGFTPELGIKHDGANHRLGHALSVVDE